MKRILSLAVPLFLLAGISQVSAQAVNVPNVFQANSPAVAAEVNANFATLGSAIGQDRNRIQILETQIAALEKRLAALEANPASGGSATPDSLVGTYALLSMNHDLHRAFNDEQGDYTFGRINQYLSKGTVTFTSGGALSATIQGGEHELGWYYGGKEIKKDEWLNYVDFDLRQNVDSGNPGGTWSLVGSALTVTIDGTQFTGYASGDNSTLLLTSRSYSGTTAEMGFLLLIRIDS